MNMCYVKEMLKKDELLKDKEKNLPMFFKEILIYIRKCFNIVLLKQIGSKKILVIPKIKDNIFKKVGRKLYKEFIKVVILTDNLYKIEKCKNEIYSNNIDILNGRKLFNYLVPEVIEYILKIQEKKLQEEELTFLINDYNQTNIYIIKLLAKKSKRINIITNNIEKFRNIEKSLYDEFGITIILSNNKKKSLAKKKLIINFDFTQETINKFKLYSEAIIVNIKEKINLKSKIFNGININYYNIKLDKEHIEIFKQYDLEKSFNKMVLYESFLPHNERIEFIIKTIENDNIKITGLIGNNGIINEMEFKKLTIQNDNVYTKI